MSQRVLNRHCSQVPPTRAIHGFTLVELLVVIGVIVLLIGLLVPMINKAYKTAVRSRITSDLHVIIQGLEAYKLDQRDYPRLALPDEYPNHQPDATGQLTPIDGAVLLCWALYAPGPDVAATPNIQPDGANGPGFRQRGTTGTVYGPYIAVNALRIGNISDPMLPGNDDRRGVFVDRYDKPIYYCPARPNSSDKIRQGQGCLWPYEGNGLAPMWDYHYFDTITQNPGGVAGVSNATLSTVLHTDPSGAYIGTDPPFIAPFLLWDAGVNQDYNNPKSYVSNIGF
jgi:type II secretory pathway pseudopilin PulG